MPNTVSLMGKNPDQPFDLQAEQARLQLAQKLSEALLMEGLSSSSPTIDAGGGVRMANWSDPLGKAIQAMAGQSRLRGVQDQQADLTRRYNQQFSDKSSEYMRLRTGGGEGGMPGKPNPIAAITYALQSNDPTLKAIAQKDIEALPGGVDWLKNGSHFAPGALEQFAQSGNPGELAGRPTLSINNDVGTKVQDGNILGTQPTQTFGAIQREPVTGIAVQPSDQTGKLTPMSGGNVTPATHTQNKLADTEIAQIQKGFEAYQQSKTNLATIAQVETELKAIPDDKFGTLASFRNSFSRLNEMLGGKPLQPTSGIEAIRSGMGQLVLQDARKLAPVTENDVAMLQQIIGSEGLTKRSLQKVLEVTAAANARAMKAHRDFVESVQGRAGYPDDMVKTWAPDFSVTALPPGAPPQGGEGSAQPKNWVWDGTKLVPR